jgi:hypothetical protein
MTSFPTSIHPSQLMTTQIKAENTALYLSSSSSSIEPHSTATSINPALLHTTGMSLVDNSLENIQSSALTQSPLAAEAVEATRTLHCSFYNGKTSVMSDCTVTASISETFQDVLRRVIPFEVSPDSASVHVYRNNQWDLVSATLDSPVATIVSPEAYILFSMDPGSAHSDDIPTPTQSFAPHVGQPGLDQFTMWPTRDQSLNFHLPNPNHLTQPFAYTTDCKESAIYTKSQPMHMEFPFSTYPEPQQTLLADPSFSPVSALTPFHLIHRDTSTLLEGYRVIGPNALITHNEGLLFVSQIVDVLYYLDPHLDKMDRRGHKLPSLFANLPLYQQKARYQEQLREREDISSRKQRICRETLGRHLELLRDICRTTAWLDLAEFKEVRAGVEGLINTIQSHMNYLERVNNNMRNLHERSEPARDVRKHMKTYVIESKKGPTSPTYIPLSHLLHLQPCYQPISLQDIEPSDTKRKWKYIHGIAIDVPIMLCRYTQGNYLGTLNFCWRIPSDPAQRDPEQHERALQLVADQLPKYPTRSMRGPIKRNRSTASSKSFSEVSPLSQAPSTTSPIPNESARPMAHRFNTISEYTPMYANQLGYAQATLPTSSAYPLIQVPAGAQYSNVPPMPVLNPIDFMPFGDRSNSIDYSSLPSHYTNSRMIPLDLSANGV